MARLAAGDRRAMARLHSLTSGRLYAVCLRVLGDAMTAEEVLQDVYLAVWRRPDAFDPARGGVMTWLIAICRNRCIDRLRSRRRSFIIAVEDHEELARAPDPTPGACDQLLAQEAVDRLYACIDALEPSTAAAVRSAFEGERTYEALAEAAGVPEGTMKSRIRRGLSKVRAAYVA